MAGDIKFEGNSVIVEGTAVFSGKIVSTEQEIETIGPVAGLAFSDRNETAFNSPEDDGSRYVWYCADRQARLWANGKNDIIVVFPEKGLPKVEVRGILAPIQLNVDLGVKAQWVQIAGLGNVGEAIKSLQQQVESLQQQVESLQLQVAGVVGGNQNIQSFQSEIVTLKKIIIAMHDDANAVRRKVGLPFDLPLSIDERIPIKLGRPAPTANDPAKPQDDRPPPVKLPKATGK